MKPGRAPPLPTLEPPRSRWPTRLTGRRFSLKSNPGERIQSWWMDRRIDGWKDGDADTWRSDERAYRGQVEGTRRRLQGQGHEWTREVRHCGEWILTSIKPDSTSHGLHHGDVRRPSKTSNLTRNRSAGRGARGRRDSSAHQLLFQRDTQTHIHT